jgi:putative phosphoesterase
MPEKKIAVLADIHGNRWALEAVLQDMAKRGIKEAVNLGDSLYGPLDPAGTARLMMKGKMTTVRGNEDRILVDPPEGWPHPNILAYAQAELEQEHLDWIASQPVTTIAFDRFFICHGTPENDETYLLQEVTKEGVRARKEADLAAQWPAGTDCRILLCGHDHTPGMARLPDGKVVINPGSVGLPAFTDELPYPHAMANGTPHARYCVVSLDGEGWQVESINLNYDWDEAAAAAMKRSRPDWAKWLKTGRI